MEYQLHRTVVSDHELMVDGKVFKEHKSMAKKTEEGNESEDYSLIHHRSIDDKYYIVSQNFKDGEMESENVDTNLDDNAIETFKEEWEECWKPTIGEKPTGIFGKLKNMLKWILCLI